ncbi:MAG: Penicillin-binding protein 2 [Chlamydiae bacterium]|nr:Penicillin-binding protein 2 [Chlamydiota bacterium]
MRHRKRRPNPSLDIPSKANRVLNLILIGIILIVIRVWHLGVIQHEERLEESRKPQRRVVVQPAKRGTIRDRYNLPLAINKVRYTATLLYSQIRQVPSIVWEKQNGQRMKHYKRREYITDLSHLLGEELHLDPERLEDLIHAKASFYNHIPFVIKDDISEKEYYRLKMLEKDWLGIHVQCAPKRDYPMGMVAGDIIGYTGAISREEYETIIQEIKALETFLEEREISEESPLPPEIQSVEEAERRLQDLIEHAYSINDYVGKTGIEERFEENLRGYLGKKSYYSDARGNYLRELPEAKAALSGQRILLTISSELQEFAEKLLMINEKIRSPRVSGVGEADQDKLSKKQPWIKGGAIVAMDPFNGDILALASYPRFDPNDFIASGNPEISKHKNDNIRRWFETEGYVGEIWDQRRPLEREHYDDEKNEIMEEKMWLTWEKYLDFALPEGSPVREKINHLKTVGNAVRLQKNIEKILVLTEQEKAYPLFNLLYRGEKHKPHGQRLPAVEQEALAENLKENTEHVLEIKKHLDIYLEAIPENYDKVLLIDLSRLVVNADLIPDELLQAIEKQTLSEYRNASAAWVTVEKSARQMSKELFREVHFKPWRNENQKEFLKQKRAEEKAAGKRYAKPYIDLLDHQENEMFDTFWEENRWNIIATFLTGHSHTSQPELFPYNQHFLIWKKELEQGAHQSVPWRTAYLTLKDAIDTLPEQLTISYLKSLRSFEDLHRPLLGKYRYIHRLGNTQKEKHLATAFYPSYGFGYARSHAYRQSAISGSIFKIITAYESLIQRYNKFDGKATNFSTLNPLVIVDDTHKKKNGTFIGYDSNGKPIPQLYKGGRIPRSHRSGIGKVDMIKALEVSSNPYFSLLAVDHLNNPNDLAEAARQFSYGSRTGIDLPAEICGRVPQDLDCNRNGLYAMAVGQHSLVVTPLQTAVMLSAIANRGKILKPKIVNMIVGKNAKQHENDQNNLVTKLPTEIKNEIFMPAAVRNILLEGMYRVVVRGQASTWGSLSRMYQEHPEAISDYLDLKDQLVGKSSTAESMEHLDLDLNIGTNLYNHIWFGGIVYDPDKSDPSTTFVFQDRLGKPELVVVVYLRFGAWGKDAAPLAAQVAQKWREIKKKNAEK